MAMLRTLVLLAQSLVILTISMAGAAVADSVFSQDWHGVVVTISRH